MFCVWVNERKENRISIVFTKGRLVSGCDESKSQPRGFPITFTNLHGNIRRNLKMNVGNKITEPHIIFSKNICSVHLEEENNKHNTGAWHCQPQSSTFRIQVSITVVLISHLVPPALKTNRLVGNLLMECSS